MYCWQVWDLMTVLRCWWPIYYMETSLTKRCHQHHCQQTIHRSLRTKMPENIFKIPEDFGHVPKYQTVAFTRAKSQKIFHWDLLLNRTRWFPWIFQILKIMKFCKIFPTLTYQEFSNIFVPVFWHFGTPRTKKLEFRNNFPTFRCVTYLKHLPCYIAVG